MDNLIDRDKTEECEWCHDCKEYNKEKHCCPRFNRVIKDAIEEIHQNSWKTMDEEPPVKSGMYICTISEEYEEFFDRDAAPIAFRYFDSEQGSFGFWVDMFHFDVFEEEPEPVWETIPVLAWMESPMPYKPGQ